MRIPVGAGPMRSPCSMAPGLACKTWQLPRKPYRGRLSGALQSRSGFDVVFVKDERFGKSYAAMAGFCLHDSACGLACNVAPLSLPIEPGLLA